MKNTRRGFVPLLIIILVVAAIGGGAYIYSKNKPITQNSEVKNNIQATSTIQTADWKTYLNAHYGFEFKYPQNLEVQGTDVISIIPKGYEGDGYIFNIRSNDNANYEQLSKEAVNNKITESDYTLGNITAKKINAKFDFGGGINYILFTNNDKKFIIMTDLTTEQQQILSTFKFIPNNIVSAKPVDTLPTKIGGCTVTTITDIQFRLNASDSGNIITYQNGGKQVTQQAVTAITHSQVSDKVKLCLISIPKDCPVGDTRGRNYKATNQRTLESWEAIDSNHSCGGA